MRTYYGDREYRSTDVNDVHIRITIDKLDSELFKFYNHTHYMTLAVMHEI